MGMDVMTEEGVVLEIKHLNKLIREEDMEKITKILMKECKSMDSDLADNFAPLIKATKEGITAKQFIKAMADTVKAVEKKNWDWREEDYAVAEPFGYKMMELWGSIIEKTRPDFPSIINEVTMWTNARISGDDVPIGKVCFVFGDSFWERKLTAEGEEFEKLFGEGSAEVSSWTIMSY